MIPPLPDLRLRSINRWLKERNQKMSDEERSRRASDLDDVMIQEFEELDDALMSRLMKERVWGTEEGLRTYLTERLMNWQEICQQHLPATFGQDQED